MHLYRVVITDRSHVPQGELTNFGDFRFIAGLNKLATLSFTVRLDNTHADRLVACDAFVKVYREGTLVFFGPVVTAEESVERHERSVAVNCADGGWILSKRLFGRTSTGYTVAALTNRATIAKNIIDEVNSATGETGVSTTAHTLSAGSSSTYKSAPYRPVLEGIAELGGTLDGFDWRFTPIENWINNARTNAKIAGFQASTIIGVQKPNAVFEYGSSTRSNVLSYTRNSTRDTQANRVYHLGSDASTVVQANDTTSQSAWGIMEAVAEANLFDAGMRQKLVDEHVSVRRNPRNLVKMTPHIDPGVTGRLPLPFVDYSIGDQIRFHSVIDGKVRFSGWLRVYGLSIAVDNESGFERVELVLEDDS